MSHCAPQIAEGVSRELARERSALISNTLYNLDLELRPHGSRMSGHILIHFDLARPVDPLVLDFRGHSARNLQLNGVAAELNQVNGHILVAGARLQPGPNAIELDFDSVINRFTDVQDGNEYLYTLFVPMDASLAFPCFDQPDLKAGFQLNVKAPPGWTVISNEKTKPISTYLFAFAAGPFECIESSGLRLFVRKSMVSKAKHEWPAVAELTRKGMDLMSAFFDQPFPFPRYDNVLIPGFPYGGMEHAGATFFNEDTILFQTIPTANDYNRRSSTVLHELAHQWFGDLVTMRWFDDLWLKEGFAQYMAYYAMAQMEPPAAVWKRFYQSIKPLAYGIDSTHGTTPIYQQVPNLKDAKSAYGAIVYQKAPSLLRLLAFKIGDERFREGVRIFLRKHAWSNADFSDLVAAFSQASGEDLLPWAKAWVEQRGMPQVEISWDCDGQSRISNFRIFQRDALNEGHLWPIRTQVLLGYKNVPPERIAASLDGATAEIPAAIGKSCPDYVFANDEDQAYGEFLLDPQSQAAVIEELPRIADPFLRSLLWGALWDSVRELRMSPSEYAELALRLLPSESDTELAVAILGRLRTAYTTLLSDGQRASMTPRLEDLLLRGIAQAPTPDLRIASFRTLIAVTATPRAREVLNDLLTGRLTIPGVPLMPRDRWNIVGALAAAGDPSAAGLLKAESRRDPSGDGRKYAYVSGAAFATPENKQRYFPDYLAAAGVREDWIAASLPLFNHWSQTALTAPYLQPALDALPQLKRERKIFFIVNWLAAFIGSQNSSAALQSVDDYLARHNPEPDLRLKILEARDELARAVRIRAAAL